MAGGLGAALRRFWERPARVAKPVQGWHAQISALTKTPRGYEAAVRVGLHVKQRRTLEGWLSQTIEPNAANKRLIRDAYLSMIRVWDPSVENRDYDIVGEIDSGDRTRNRLLSVDGSDGDWGPIREAYLAGASDEELEELFIEYVIEEAIGETSGDGWGFPGESYTL